MKKLMILLLVAATVSCAKKKDATNSPEFVMNQIKTAIEAADTKALGTLLCTKDQNILKAINALGGGATGSVGKLMVTIVKNQLAKSHKLDFDNITFQNEKIDGNNATLEAFNSKKEKTRTYNFVKEEGVWRLCI